MNARDKHLKVFGQLHTLEEQMSWTDGLSNMMEWLVWSPKDVLGVTKNALVKQVVVWAVEYLQEGKSVEGVQKYVRSRFDAALRASDVAERYAKPASAIASAREATRRAKYFSEDYLNKEFDIFLALASDAYLDSLYAGLVDLEQGHTWYTHGNSARFEYSTNIQSMQMDNLAYNPGAELLVANELKLGGKKNPDQMLKYALMHERLRTNGFIAEGTQLALVFIGDKAMSEDWMMLIDAEIAHCESNPTSPHREVLEPQVLEIAHQAKYRSLTWQQLMAFNRSYLERLDRKSAQVERKLLCGFNESLASKAFMQEAH